MSKQFYRYFCRSERPNDLVPPPFEGMIRMVSYEEPMDSGNGKRIYGYIDFETVPSDAEIVRCGLEAAAVNPISE